MKAMNVTQARANLFQLIANVNASSEPITLTNNKGKNAVLIGEDDWNAIQETLYLNSIPGMVESLTAGKECPIDDCISEKDVEYEGTVKVLRMWTHYENVAHIR